MNSDLEMADRKAFQSFLYKAYCLNGSGSASQLLHGVTEFQSFLNKSL